MSEAGRQRFLRLMNLAREGKLAEAETALQAALRVTPKDPNILHLAAHVAELSGDKNKAIAFNRRAVLAHPGWLEATFNLARLLGASRKAREREEACALLEDLSRYHADRPEIWEAIARFAQNDGRLPQALAAWRKALALKPDNPEGLGQYLFLCRQLCIWDEEIPATVSFSPQISVLFFDDPARQKEAAERFVKRRMGAIAPLPPPPPYAHARKRVGYLSSDFHAHATAWLMAELFSLHDRGRFEVFAYSYGVDDGSGVRARIKREADHFADLSPLTPLQCAELIRADEIDVLVELKGHTTGGRLDILARRPAPFQIHWLGFPATTGAPFIDAFVGDSVTIPQGDEIHFSEKILRLPHSYQINDRQKKSAAPKNKSLYGLPEEAFVLASFNQNYKITSELFDCWCFLLRENLRSVLWLYASNDEAPHRLRHHAEARGIDPSRLVFAAPLPLEEHLARYAHVDLALDTFPVGGHTTTSDALWCGVPVVARAGNSFVSRVAASLLTAAGLPELVTNSAENYKSLCLDLMRNDDRRTALKDHLKSKRERLPLFDTPAFVRAWEDLLLRQ